MPLTFVMIRERHGASRLAPFRSLVPRLRRRPLPHGGKGDFTIEVTVTDASGRIAYDDHFVAIVAGWYCS